TAVLVATPATSGDLDALGLPRIDDLRGRWATNEDCIRDTFATLYPTANPSALAALAPEESRLRDFIVQNALFTFYARPFLDGWAAEQDVLAETPPNQPVFGYLAKTVFEEGTAVNAISHSGKFLTPSDM